MLAFSTNQPSVADSQGPTANLLALDVSGTQQEPVLLSPGKWTVGSATSNQIVLSDNGIAPQQFLIIVTTHRSVIKDWSGKALCNGEQFDDAVLRDGDTVQIADVRMTFRLAESLELISQLPCVAEPGDHDEGEGQDVEPSTFTLSHEPATDAIEFQTPGPENTNHETADGMVVPDDEPDRLDSLISRIQSAHQPEGSVPTAGIDIVPEPDGKGDGEELDSEIDFQASKDDGIPQKRHSSLNSQSTLIDAELRQLEELRAAVQLEREELLAKREVLAQETIKVQSELEATTRQQQSSAPDSMSESQLDLNADSVDSDTSDGSEENAADVVDCLLHEPAVDGEEAAVTVEREKLRHYLEEFESADGTGTDEAVEDEDAVGVGAAHLATTCSLTNTMRSREEAVKQLDDLVLAATQSLDSNGPLITNAPAGGSGNGPFFESNDTDGVRDRSEFRISEDSDESAAEPEHVDIEASVEELEALLHEAESTDCEFTTDEEAEDLTSRETVLFSEAQPGDTIVIGEAPADDSLHVDEDPDGACEESQFSLQSSNHCEFVEESVGETSDQFVSETTKSFEEPSQAEPVLDDSQPEAAVESTVLTDPIPVKSEPLQGSTPSWFDSNFITKDDSVSGSSDERSTGEWESAAELQESESAGDNADDSDNTSPDELRQKLAEMFDLPTQSETTEQALPEDALKERLQQFRDEDQSQETKGAGTVEQVGSSWEPLAPEAEPNSMNDDATADLSFDPLAVSSSEPGSEYESETLDEFSSGTHADDSEDKPASETSSVFEPEVQDEADESINAYMERLLARNRQVMGGRVGSNDANHTEESSAASHNNAGSDASASAVESSNGRSNNGNNDAFTKRETWHDDTPRHQQNQDKVRADVQVLRQIANQSARSAVATASRRNIRKQVLVKTTASLLALGTGVAALLMNVSLTFGLIVLGIGMVFSVDLSLTIFRNLMQIRKLKRSVATVRDESAANDSDASGFGVNDARSAGEVNAG